MTDYASRKVSRFWSAICHWHRYWHLILLACLLFLTDSLHAREQGNITLFLDREGGAYKTFKEHIEQHIQHSTAPKNNLLFFTINNLNDEQVRQIVSDAGIIVSAGVKSATAISLIAPSVPHIATLLTLEAYTSNLTSHRNKIKKSCGLVVDQPLERVLAVLGQELPEIKRVGIIESAEDHPEAPEIKTLGSTSDIEIIREQLNGDIHATIKRLAQGKAEAIVALRNPAVYNRNTARNILISSYHFNLPVIGYSSGFVKAGALMGVYTKPELLADEVYHYINNPGVCRNDRIIYPSTYTIEVNPQVAKSLGINPAITLTIREKTVRKRPAP